LIDVAQCARGMQRDLSDSPASERGGFRQGAYGHP
jgi:hypothetical protein